MTKREEKKIALTGWLRRELDERTGLRQCHWAAFAEEVINWFDEWDTNDWGNNE